MTEELDEDSEVLKSMEKLENQNIRLKYLVAAISELVTEDAEGVILESNSKCFSEKLESLKKVRLVLNVDKADFLEDEEKIQEISHKLEEENAEMRAQIDKKIKKIKLACINLSELKGADEELQQILIQLELENTERFDELSADEYNSSEVTTDDLHWKKRIEIETESENISNINRLGEHSSSEVSPAIQSGSEESQQDVQNLEDDVSIKGKISELEHKNEELIKVIQKSNSDKEAEIAHTNTQYLNKVEVVRSKITELNSEFSKTLEKSNNSLGGDISKLEDQKKKLYNDLKQYLLDSSKGIHILMEDITDPEIKRLINEIELQKSILLYSLQSAHFISLEQDCDELNCALSKRSEPTKSNGVTSSEGISKIDDTPSKRLQDEINRLEHVKVQLLEQLRSVSATSASRSNANATNAIPHNERQLQTQSELHSNFMRESSHEVVMGQNYDDATNQLYASEDARLEQRIRELEMENIRIQTELDNILEEIRADKNEMSRLECTGQVLRERIEELEQNAEKNEERQDHSTK